MKKYQKNTEGITLVALIITIIVLIILAGITISQLTEGGLFERAQQAKEKQENAQVEEYETLGEYENKIGYYVDGTREQVLIDKEEYENLKLKVQELDNKLKNANVYSENEIEIGTWIDGKKLYRKTYIIKNFTTTSTIDISNLDYDYIQLYSRVKMTDGTWRETFYFPNNYFIDVINSTGICFTVTSNYNGGTVYCVVEYTKTTDTAKTTN